MRPLRVALFASGTGSNVQALIKKAQSLGADRVEISFVLSDKPEALVLDKARAAGIKIYVVEKEPGREQQEQKILQLLQEHKVDWIFLAGYMRILSSNFLRQFSAWHAGQSQIVNIHPSLLPAFPGMNSIERAFMERVPETGVTLHYVDEGVDTGAIIVQSARCFSPFESLEIWEQKIHELEHAIYTHFLEKLVNQEPPTCFFQENL